MFYVAGRFLLLRVVCGLFSKAAGTLLWVRHRSAGMCGRCSGKNGGAGYGVDSLIILSLKSIVSCISCVVKRGGGVEINISDNTS